MSKSNDKLERMMKNLTPEQKKSLNKIRTSVEEIWGVDHIISDFTDHGVDHSLRLVNYASDMLNNNNFKLTQEETYLLLSSIFLHDIGMQCYAPNIFDKFLQEAENIARDKKLSFKVIEFTAKSAMKLNENEQNFIREYHSLLTAAMINYSFNNPDYILHEACRDFQTNLRKDLEDICLYHSKYPIIDCEENLSIIIGGRKRLIAAILRLADELDIDYNRIRDSDYKILKRDSKNLVYWLKHKYTTVQIQGNEINLTIALYPTDLEKYGHILQGSIINDFCCKNKKVMEVLNFYGINIKLSDQSDRKNGIPKLIADRGQEKIPTDIVDEFKKLEHTKKHISRCRYKYNIAEFNQNIKKDVLNNDEDFNILVLGDVMLDSTMHMIDAPFDQVLAHDRLNMVYALLHDDSYLLKILGIDSPDVRSLGGAAGIVTTLLQIPKVHVDIVSIIGEDSEGYEIQGLFNNLKQQTSKNGESYLNFYPICIKEYPTVTKHYYKCYKDFSQGIIQPTIYRFDRENVKLIYNNFDKYEERFKEELSKISTSYDCIIIMDHRKGMINDFVINWLRDKYPDVKLFIDPKYDWTYYKDLHIKAIIPNIKEASMGIRNIAELNDEAVKSRVMGSDLEENDYDSLKKCLLNCDSFIIKSDRHGAVIYSKEYNNNIYFKDFIFPYPIDESKEKSTIGCGDTFDAYYVIGQLKKYTLQTSVKLANIAAGIKRKKELGEVVKPKEVYDEINNFCKSCIHGCDR